MAEHGFYNPFSNASGSIPFQDQPQEWNPFTQYLAQSGLLGRRQTDPGVRYGRGLYDPLRNMYEIQSKVGRGIGMLPGDWQGEPGEPSYLGGFQRKSGYGSLQGDIYRRAEALLSGLYNIGGEQRISEGIGFTPRYDEFGQPISGSFLPAEYQQGLFQSALARQWGARTAQHFSRRMPRMQQLYQERRATGQARGFNTFLDWLRDRYDLGQYIGGTDPGNMATGPYNQPIIPGGNPAYIPDPGSQYDQSPKLATRITEAGDTTWMAKDIKPANFLGTAKEWWDDIPDANGMRISDYPTWVADQRFGESQYGNPDDLYGIA